MHDEQQFLRHVVATIAYRGGKVIRDAPPGFANVRVCDTTRSAVAILAHLGDLLEWSARMADGNREWKPAAPQSWDRETERFFRALAALDARLAADAPFEGPVERIFQGPLADSLTHIGQLATLRRFAGSPVKSENFFIADIQAGRVGREQAAPKFEFD